MSAPSPSARLARRTHRLRATALRLSRQGKGALDALCREVLAAPSGGEDPLSGGSRLNNDCVPLQLCLTATAHGAALRLIGDPATHLPDLEDRWRASSEALAILLRSTGSDALAPLAARTLAALVPATPAGRARHRNGFLWLAASPDRPGLAFYADCAPLGAAGGWEAVTAWLRDLLPAGAEALSVLARLRESCEAASAGVEGTCPQDARLKLYFRLRRPLPLAALEVPLLADGTLLGFLEDAMGTSGVDRDGLLLCVGFAAQTGRLADVKADLCGHCLARTADEWIALVEAWSARHRLAPLPLAEALRDGATEVAFVGLGLDAARRPRLNVYLKDAPRAAPDADELSAALEDAVRYLVRIQDARGRWTDYALPVGASDEWVTAFVAHGLARCGRIAGTAGAHDAALRGARWLEAERAYPAGWGYNGQTGPDADSTAYAVALFHELGRPVRPADQAFLAAHWRAGGMTTYLDGPGAWSDAHWDVTPLGYLGLAPAEQRARRAAFLAALAASRLPDGSWRAYWWRTPSYGTLTTLEALETLGLAAGPVACAPSDDAFDLACCVGIAALQGMPPSAAWLRRLLDAQDADGRFPGGANLRVTDDACHEPWNAPAGASYVDQAGTLTTALTARVLARLLADRARGARPARASA